MSELFTHLAFYAGWPAAASALTCLNAQEASCPDPNFAWHRLASRGVCSIVGALSASVWWRSSRFRQQTDFSFIERAADEQRIYDPHYLSEGRSARFVLFHIFAGKPRSRAQKQGLYRRLCARLDDEMAVSPQDVMVVIQFNQREDWSFSAGKMADE